MSHLESGPSWSQEETLQYFPSGSLPRWRCCMKPQDQDGVGDLVLPRPLAAVESQKPHGSKAELGLA